VVNISWHCTVAGICICVCVLMLCFLFASSVGGYVVQGKLHCYYFCCVVLCCACLCCYCCKHISIDRSAQSINSFIRLQECGNFMCFSFVTKLKKTGWFLSGRIAPDDILAVFFLNIIMKFCVGDEHWQSSVICRYSVTLCVLLHGEFSRGMRQEAGTTG